MHGHVSSAVAGAPAARGVRSLFALGLLAGLFAGSGLARPLSAQEAPPLRYARIAVDKTQPFCWPSAVAAPPRFEDVLDKGDVVQVGRSEGAFVMVQLPLGPLGYVSKRFATADDDGKVKTKGSKVAFRYRAKSSEAPVAQLDDGTELFVVAEQDDWWIVRLPSIEAWLPATEVQVADQSDPTLATAFAAAKEKVDGVVRTRLDGIAADKKQKTQNAADEAAVQVIADGYQNELGKPVIEQDFAPLEEALTKLDAGLAETSTGKAAVVSLRKRIQAQKWIVEATKLREEPAKPSAEPLPAQQPADDLARFHAIGWLRYESRIGGPGTFYLEKGGLRLYHVTCTTQRYDLSLFVDCEVGVQGPRRRPANEAFSLLDAERIEVLGHNRM